MLNHNGNINKTASSLYQTVRRLPRICIFFYFLFVFIFLVLLSLVFVHLDLLFLMFSFFYRCVRISIRGLVRRLVGWSVGPSVMLSSKSMKNGLLRILNDLDSAGRRKEG